MPYALLITILTVADKERKEEMPGQTDDYGTNAYLPRQNTLPAALSNLLQYNQSGYCVTDEHAVTYIKHSKTHPTRLYEFDFGLQLATITVVQGDRIAATETKKLSEMPSRMVLQAQTMLKDHIRAQKLAAEQKKFEEDTAPHDRSTTQKILSEWEESLFGTKNYAPGFSRKKNSMDMDSYLNHKFSKTLGDKYIQRQNKTRTLRSSRTLLT